MRIFFFLLALLLHNQFVAQNISVFSKIEADVLGSEFLGVSSDVEFYIYDKAWLASHPPYQIQYSEVDSSGPVSSETFILTFERFSDCRIKKIHITDNTSPEIYDFDFEYDLANRKVTVTSVYYENSTTVEYYWRIAYQYDANGNITQMDAYEYDDVANDFVLDEVLNFGPYDSCNNYLGYTDVYGTTNNMYNVARAYLTGTCRQAMAVFSRLNGTPQQRSYAWTYDGAGHITTLKYTNTNNICSGLKLDYDAQGNRIRIFDMECDNTVGTLEYAYGWNNNQSLAYIDFQPNAVGTWERYTVSYAPCGTTSALQPTTSTPEIRCVSPVNAGQMVSVFNLPEDINCQWKLIDLQSKTVLEGKWAANESTFNLPANLPGGLYTLVVSSEDHNLMTTLRLVVASR